MRGRHDGAGRHRPGVRDLAIDHSAPDTCGVGAVRPCVGLILGLGDGFRARLGNNRAAVLDTPLRGHQPGTHTDGIRATCAHRDARRRRRLLFHREQAVPRLVITALRESRGCHRARVAQGARDLAVRVFAVVILTRAETDPHRVCVTILRDRSGIDRAVVADRAAQIAVADRYATRTCGRCLGARRDFTVVLQRPGDVVADADPVGAGVAILAHGFGSDLAVVLDRADQVAGIGRNTVGVCIALLGLAAGADAAAVGELANQIAGDDAIGLRVGRRAAFARGPDGFRADRPGIVDRPAHRSVGSHTVGIRVAVLVAAADLGPGQDLARVEQLSGQIIADMHADGPHVIRVGGIATLGRARRRRMNRARVLERAGEILSDGNPVGADVVVVVAAAFSALGMGLDGTTIGERPVERSTDADALGVGEGIRRTSGTIRPGLGADITRVGQRSIHIAIDRDAISPGVPVATARDVLSGHLDRARVCETPAEIPLISTP